MPRLWTETIDTHRREVRDADGSWADYERALKLQPDLAIALRGRGSWWLQVDEPAKALADLNRAIELDPQDERAFLTRGMAYLRIGNKDAAEKDLAETLRLCPYLAAEIAAGRKRMEAWSVKS